MAFSSGNGRWGAVGSLLFSPTAVYRDYPPTPLETEATTAAERVSGNTASLESTSTDCAVSATAGDRLVVALADDGAAALSSLASDLDGAFSLVVEKAWNSHVGIYELAVATTGTHTVTATFAGTANIKFSVEVLRNVGAATLSASANDVGIGVTYSHGVVSPTGPGVLITAARVGGGIASFGAADRFVLTDIAGENRGITQYRVIAEGLSTDGAFVGDAAVSYDAVIAFFPEQLVSIGTAAQTLDAATVSGAGTAPVAGTAAQALGDATVSAAAEAPIGATNSFPDTAVLDDFNRANEGPPPSANWSDFGAGGKVLSNQWAPGGAGSALSLWIAGQFTLSSNQQVYATVGTLPPTDGSYFVIGWCDGSINGYQLAILWLTNRWVAFLGRLDAAVGTTLAVSDNLPLVDGVKIGLRSVDGVHQAVFDLGDGWKVRTTVIDTTYASSLYGFIGGSGAATYRFDDFGGGASVGVALGSIGLTADADLLVAATASQALDALTQSASGTVADASISGTADITLDAATASAAGTVLVQGSAAQTLGDATQAASGAVPIVASAAQTLGDATLAGSGVAPIVGSAAQTLDPATVAGAGAALVAGSAAQTLGVATLIGAGEVPAVGTAAQTLDAATVAGVGGGLVQASAAQTLGDATLSADGVTPVVGTAAQSLTDATQSATAETPIVGTAGQALGAVTVASAVGVLVQGSAAITLDPLTQVADGTGQQVTTGSADITLDDATQVASGTVDVAGAAAQTLGAAMQAAAAEAPIAGVAGQTLAALTVAGAGGVSLVGSGASTLGDLTLAAAAGVVVAGAAAQGLDDLAQTGAGVLVVAGGAAIVLDPLLISGTGAVANLPPIEGMADILLDDLTSRSILYNPARGVRATAEARRMSASRPTRGAAATADTRRMSASRPSRTTPATADTRRVP